MPANGPFLTARMLNPSVNFPKTKVERVDSITCYAAEPELRGSNVLEVGAA
jgi:hypothetical protein